MNILLSAYACEPNKGSEPGVGWSWAQELAKHHNVWVITRDNNEPTISQYLEENPEFQNANLHFIYVGLSKKLTFWKKGRRGMRLFYMLWQRKAAKVAIEWNKKVGFDYVQHVTFVNYTQPTYMYKLGIPFIWGPVSGGENIPGDIKIEMTIKEHIVEEVRKLSQLTALCMISTNQAMKHAKKILVTTEETKKKIPKKYQHKTIIMPAIGMEKIPEVLQTPHDAEKIKIVMAGRLIYWKAFDIGVKAFLKLAEKYPNVELHILGEGNQKNALKKLAGKYLDKQIYFIPPVQHDEIYQFYSGFDIFMNTTLRDSGCMTMMEAMSVGLPCIAIATGGPGVLLDEFSECVIRGKSYGDYVSSTEALLENLITNKEMRLEIGKSQKDYVINNLKMSEKVRKIYEWR